MVDKGETFELLNEADRLIDWYRKNKPGWQGPLTLPRVWCNRRVAQLVPRFAQCYGGEWFYREIPLRVQGEQL
jgi:hypothetical protein